MMNTSVPRMFSSIWNETSESGNRRSRAWPTETPRKFAMSRVNSGCALPEKTFSSPNPVAMNGSPTLSPSMTQVGWGGRIRTFEYGIQSPAPYRLATPHRPSLANPQQLGEPVVAVTCRVACRHVRRPHLLTRPDQTEDWRPRPETDDGMQMTTAGLAQTVSVYDGIST